MEMIIDVPIEVTLINAPNTARILTSSQDALQVQFHKVGLRVSYIRPALSVVNALEEKLRTSMLTYPYLSTELINVTTIPQGVQEAEIRLTGGLVMQNLSCCITQKFI